MAHLNCRFQDQRILPSVADQKIAGRTVRWQHDLPEPAPTADAVVIDGSEVRGGKVRSVIAPAQPSQRLPTVETRARKTNEIPTAQTLIRRPDRTGRVVQLEAIPRSPQPAPNSPAPTGATAA